MKKYLALALIILCGQFSVFAQDIKPSAPNDGDIAFRKAIDRTKSGKELELAYKELLKFPAKKIGASRTTHEIALGFVITAFANENNPEKALFYMNMLKSKSDRCMVAYFLISSFLKYGHHKEAKMLIKEAMDNSYNYKTIWKDSVSAPGSASLYPGFLNMNANILFEEKNYKEAYLYQKKAYNETDSSRRIELNELMAKICLKLGKDTEAFEKLDELVRQGMLGSEMKEDLKVLYRKVKGNVGFEEYMATVQKSMAEKIRKELEKQIINQPAPAFTLTDLNGKQVSLESLKGKIVVVDFWATWCKPCIASFPGMQAAVNKYKNDPTVEFLFVHTWEQEDQQKATANAAKFIADHKYPFKVLMDLKDPATGINKVISDFKVKGIPTKFVIDKNGNIRFMFVGSKGGVDSIVEEVTAMIELTKKNTE